ncbi:MAG: GFA family protein [Caulobacteraceae bacterium]
MHTASCLCGAVKLRVEGDLAPIQVCHCHQCQKAQGGAFVAIIPVAKSNLAILSGEEAMTAFEGTPGKERVFCARCGSPLFSRRADLNVVRLRVGVLDPPLQAKISSHAFTASRPDWFDLRDGRPEHPGARPA